MVNGRTYPERRPPITLHEDQVKRIEQEEIGMVDRPPEETECVDRIRRVLDPEKSG